MKVAIVIETIVLCAILTVLSIFTIDAVTVRKAELSSMVATDCQKIVKDYFDEKISTAELSDVLRTTIQDSSHSKYSNIRIAISCADAEKGIVDLLVEATYSQPTGRPRLLSYRRVYIRETSENLSDENGYSFIRTIDAEHYKAAAGYFIPEEDGGLKIDSIWRTAQYELVLDSVFAN